VAAFVVVVALIGVTTFALLHGDDGPVAIASPVSIETTDGITLRGEVWDGSEIGVVVVGAYGAGVGELNPIAEPLAARGFTVLTHDLRGQGKSDGTVTPDLLDEDLADVVTFVRRRGLRVVFVVAYRHSGAAAIAAAGRGELPIDGLVGLYPLERYLEQDAVASVGSVSIPLMLIGDTNELAAAAPNGTQFRSVAPDPAIFTSSGPRIADFIHEFIRLFGS
jgi:pimeloyl-ACP methyl ester carboxylesterase